MHIELPVKINLTLRPVGQPEILVGSDQCYNRVKLTCQQTFCFEHSYTTGGYVFVEHINKAELDLETAVVIEQLDFFGISDSKILAKSLYRPQYPGVWYQQQIDQGRSCASELPGMCYLGWNGRWQLDFDVPVFAWLHQVLDLGWLYD